MSLPKDLLEGVHSERTFVQQVAQVRGRFVCRGNGEKHSL